MKKFIGLAFFILAGMGLLFWWQSPAAVDEKPATNSARLISLAPNITETLFALGVGPQIVGVTPFCKYPPATAKIEKIGAFLNPNYEKIMALKPTLIFAERWPSSKAATRLRQLNLPLVETVSPRSLEEIYRLIETLGKTLNRQEKAQKIIMEMQNSVERIQDQSQAFSWRPQVYIEIDPPTWTVGQHSFITEAITLCGGQNIFEDINRRALAASKEAIVQRNPDLIISFQFGAAAIKNRPGWDNIKAVKNDHVMGPFNPELLSHGSHRIIAGMEEMQKMIERVVDEAPPKKT